MIDARFLESFLRLNNLGDTASAKEIETTLAQAHWTPEQIEEAIVVRSGNGTASPLLAQRHPADRFRPDMNWSSSKLSSLLGIDVVIDPKAFHAEAVKKELVANTGTKILVALCTAVVALAIAAGIGLGLMYLSHIGPFYTSVEFIL